MKRLLTVMLLLVVACGVLDVVLRTTHLFHARLSWTEPDRDIGWRYTPDREYWFVAENDHAITGRINSMGWRDRERSRGKPEHTYRIAVLGDSYVDAFQVEQDSTFCAIAERRLNRAWPHTAAEVMNFGRSGFSPTEESIVLTRDVLPCHPDAVVLLFTPHNDIRDVSRVTAVDTERPFFEFTPGAADSIRLDKSFAQRSAFRMRELLNSLKQHSALVSLVTERYNDARITRAKERAGDANITREQRLCAGRPDAVYARNYRLCKSLIRRMAQQCQAGDIRFILMSAPLVYTDEEVRHIRVEAPAFDPGYFDRDLAAEAAAVGFEFIALGTALKAPNPGAARPLYWQHWNYDGHRVVAKVFADGIDSRPVTGAPRQAQSLVDQ